MGLNQFKGLESPISPSQISFGELWRSQCFSPRLLIALNTTLKSLFFLEVLITMCYNLRLYRVDEE